MHVTLLTPPQLFTRAQVTAGVVPPLGLLYLATHIRAHGLEADVVDALGERPDQYTAHGDAALRGLTLDELVSRIPARTDLIGISALFSISHPILRALVDRIRQARPGRLVVLGGAHATALAEYVLLDTGADLVVRGEGEATFLELCRHLGRHHDLPGLAVRDGDRVRLTDPRPLIDDLDTLPVPDRSLVPMDHYFAANEPHGCSRSGRWTTLLSSRGCPHRCAFCTTPLLWQRRWRPRQPDRVVAEMVELHDRFGVTDFHFEDEDIGLNKRWLHDFTDRLTTLGRPFTWQASNAMRAETLDESLLRKMRASGCSLVAVSLESAADRVRNEIIGKNLDIAAVESAISSASRLGMRTTCYYILGLPGETAAEAAQSVRHAARLARRGLDECVFGLFVPLPGSQLFAELEARGRVRPGEAFFRQLLSMGDLSAYTSWSDQLPSGRLRRLRLAGYLRFALARVLWHPLRCLRSGWNILRGTDELKSERVLRTFLKRLRRRPGAAGPGP